MFLPFTNPIDGKGPYTDAPGHATWERTGDDFETLTLSPSIQRRDPGGCAWHGYIRDGEVLDA